jgi:hypothetical protein
MSSADEKRVIRRIDWRLIPLLSVMYMVKSIDFTNVRNAAVLMKKWSG